MDFITFGSIRKGCEFLLLALMLITVVLLLGVIFVNGWTDAPNAIATAVSTRVMTLLPPP